MHTKYCQHNILSFDTIDKSFDSFFNILALIKENLYKI